MDVILVVDALGPQLSGIGRYVWELCQRLPLDPSISRLSFYRHGRLLDQVEDLESEESRSARRVPKWLRQRSAQRRLRQSIVHGPNYFLPPQCDTGIITVHDLSIFRYPETHPADRLQAFEREFESSLRRARHVITDSETVRHEVIAHFGVSEERITAVPLGVASEFKRRAAPETAAQLSELGLTPSRYGLCVSTLEPRKKIVELIRAWRELPENVRSSTPLVLAGAKGWLNEQLHDEIRAGGAAGWLRHLGYVPDPLLLALYSGAALFVYPSTYEGFGLPPLEAMASGIPVLVANRSCLPEICGDAAGYVEPEDVAEFRNAILKALTDAEWRRAAREKGLERAARFTWESCAAKTVSIYGSVLR